MLDPASGVLLAGRYRLGELLGEGGMGAVYAATDEQLGRPVAVKVLRATDAAADAESRAERFRREARVVAKLAHPHIVNVSDFGTDEATGSAFLVMERLQGRSLREIVREEKKLAPARVVAILAQTLDALVAAHEAGIVHRDLTPANVFVASVAGGAEVVKVLDFGIAKPLARGEARLTVTGQIVGTPAYLSPEQAMGAPIDARSDVYALGVLAFRCLTGRLPYDVDDPSEVFFAIVQGQKRSLAETAPTLAPELSALVDRALSVERAARFVSAREMRAALEPFLTGQMSLERTAPTLPAAATSVGPVTARELPSTLQATAVEPRRRSLVGTLALGLAIGAVTAVGVAVALIWSGGDDDATAVEPPAPSAAIPVPLPSNPPMLPTPLAVPDAGPSAAPTEAAGASDGADDTRGQDSSSERSLARGHGREHAAATEDERAAPARGGCSDIYNGGRTPPNAYDLADTSDIVRAARPSLRECFPGRTDRLCFWVAMAVDANGTASRVRTEGSLRASEEACVVRSFDPSRALPPRRDGQSGTFSLELCAYPCE